jgi:transient receptor potential cation channel subfamily M protein 3
MCVLIKGVVKHIGDVLRNHFPKSRNNIIAIGIAPWGVVSGRESLMECGVCKIND